LDDEGGIWMIMRINCHAGGHGFKSRTPRFQVVEVAAGFWGAAKSRHGYATARDFSPRSSWGDVERHGRQSKSCFGPSNLSRAEPERLERSSSGRSPSVSGCLEGTEGPQSKGYPA
jgi:hypothetical protein